jgi:hypothetical protein
MKKHLLIVAIVSLCGMSQAKAMDPYQSFGNDIGPVIWLDVDRLRSYEGEAKQLQTLESLALMAQMEAKKRNLTMQQAKDEFIEQIISAMANAARYSNSSQKAMYRRSQGKLVNDIATKYFK